MISIIMPVYNVQNYVSACIESVLKQTYTNFELIIVNDGSTDNSLKKVENFVYDSRVKIFSQENQGLSGARNTGLKYAKGDYIYFIDSDDVINHNLFEIIMNEFEVNKTVDLISFNHRERSIVQLPNLDEKLNIKEKNFLSSDEALRSLMLNEIPQMAWSYIVKTDIIKKNNISFSYGRLFEDNNSAAKIYSHCKKIERVSIAPSPYILRKRSSSITEIADKNLSSRDLEDEMYVFEDEYKTFIIVKNLENTLAQKWYFNKLNHLYIKYYLSLSSKRPDLLQKLKMKSNKIYRENSLSLNLREKEKWLRVNSKIFDFAIRLICDRRTNDKVKRKN
ncbi:glycosyltransferase family 2 protein [Limosilactobacillus reuteri]|uniref:glycosyltransferase family 2 protein n=1 Tax=Limosilactobacillus reuteri TaxID=1598 RepID=UPI00128B4015|nr:glycosyltransferase family A protein [Limosilactobacillus reuteri]MQB91537.1 glycosyltransferase family 2 protein [Limosilactobacillus reuteri]